MQSNFSTLGLCENACKRLHTLEIAHPTEIQKLAIPKLIQSSGHFILQAKTGTGKTAAFLLPVLEKIMANQHTIQTLILTPTRELAKQVYDAIIAFNTKRSVRAQLLIGGASLRQQLHFLKGKNHIIVGTPGRVLDHIEKQNSLDLRHIQHLILDEADEMMDMGFIDSIESIIGACNPQKQMVWVSATMPKSITKLAERYMPTKEFIRTNTIETNTKNHIHQSYILSEPRKKYPLLRSLIESTKDLYAVIFCKTKKGVDHLKDQLKSDDIHVTAIHGDMPQSKRERNLKKLKDKKTSLLIATDVAARGIHIDKLTHVINYDIPENGEIYTHRIGRTGRAEHQGHAVTFLSSKEQYKMHVFIKENNLTMHQHALGQAMDAAPIRSNDTTKRQQTKRKPHTNQRPHEKYASKNVKGMDRKNHPREKPTSWKPSKTSKTPNHRKAHYHAHGHTSLNANTLTTMSRNEYTEKKTEKKQKKPHTFSRQSRDTNTEHACANGKKRNGMAHQGDRDYQSSSSTRQHVRKTFAHQTARKRTHTPIDKAKIVPKETFARIREQRKTQKTHPQPETVS